MKAGIIGGAGYTAGELIRLLINHPAVTIDFVFSTSNAGNKMKNKFQRTVQNSNRKILTFLTWYNHFNKKWLVL